MALTAEGAQLMLAIAVGMTADSLTGGAIVVSDGTARAQRPLDSVDVQGAELTLVATFGEQEANFEWAVIEIVSKDGVVVDYHVADHGRKAAGAVWTLETALQLTAP